MAQTVAKLGRDAAADDAAKGKPGKAQLRARRHDVVESARNDRGEILRRPRFRRRRRVAETWQIRGYHLETLRQRPHVADPMRPGAVAAVQQHQRRAAAPYPPDQHAVAARRFHPLGLGRDPLDKRHRRFADQRHRSPRITSLALHKSIHSLISRFPPPAYIYRCRGGRHRRPWSLSMATILIGNWWALALRGAAAILFAILAFLWPAMTAAALVLLFAAYALVDGVFAIIAAVRAARHHARSWPLLLEGILDLGIAAIAFLWPMTALVALIYLIAIWAVITGIALIAAGIAFIRLNGEWLLVLSGMISLLLGIILFVQPAAGVVALSWWLGIYALLFGIALLAAAFRLRHYGPV